MKAVIVEIHKKYCILLTKDGGFIKKKVQGCAFEIGDEIETGNVLVKERHSKYLKVVLVAASFFILTTIGLVFSRDYVRSFLSPADVTIAAAPESMMEEIKMPEAADSAILYDEEDAILRLEMSPSQSFTIEEKSGKVYFDDLRVNYKVKIQGLNILSLRIENRGTDVFNGFIELSLLLADETISRTFSFDLVQFSSKEQLQEEILLEPDEKVFTLTSYRVDD